MLTESKFHTRRTGQFVRRVLGAEEKGSVTNGPNMGIVACQCGQGQDQVPTAAATSRGVNSSVFLQPLLLQRHQPSIRCQSVCGLD